MRQLHLLENAAPQPYELSATEAETLKALELADVTVALDGTFLVSAGKKVGSVRLNDLQVTVRPKVQIDRLIFLMGYALNPRYWRDHSVLLDAEDDLAEALAHAFRRLAARALEQGLLQGYRTVDEALPLVRGRIRVADQMSRRSGLGLPLEVTYDDFTVDIAENQILLAACLRLLRTPGVSPRVRQGLQRLRVQLSDVSDIPRRAPLPTWIPSRLNARYHAPLRLAELILKGESIEQRVGKVEVSGFVVDMWRVFEDFVSVALREALAPVGGSASLQHRMHLDRAKLVALRPDFVWTGHDDRQIVVDAKYKAEQPSGFPQADLYQLLAYCTVLGLPEGHLVYAKGDEDEISHDVVGAEISIHSHTIDLEASPAETLESIARIASRLVGS